MDVEDFRRHGHELVDWMADYLGRVERLPVRAAVAPGEVADRLPEAPPEEPEPFAAIMADVERIILPGLTHWQHPSFFAYFPANSSPPSVLAEMLTATLAVQGMIWQTAPAATELETRMMAWLRQMLGLPEDFVGVIQDTASSATLCAVLTARERLCGWQGNARGLADAGRLTAYCSAEAHSSVDKAVCIAGIGQDNLRKIPVDGSFAMDPAALEAAIDADRAAGFRPAVVVATLGTTGTSGFDPLGPIGEICRRAGAWLHVDAAWAGSALLLPEERWMIDGIADADSFVFNPHKWLLTNFDCSAYFVRDPAALTRTFAILPEYLKTAEGDRVVNYRDWGIPLGRRFRALKLWFVIRSYGVEGLRTMIRRHIAMTAQLAGRIAATEGFDVPIPPRLALLGFRCHPPGWDDPARLDALNETLLQRVNDSGAAYLSHTRVGGAYVIRVSVGQTATEWRHVEAAWRQIERTAAELCAA